MATKIKVTYDDKYALKVRVDIGAIFQLITVDEAKELTAKIMEVLPKES